MGHATTTINGGMSMDFGVSTTANEADAQGIVSARMRSPARRKVRGVVTRTSLPITRSPPRAIVMRAARTFRRSTIAAPSRRSFRRKRQRSRGVGCAGGTLNDELWSGSGAAGRATDLTDDVSAERRLATRSRSIFSNANLGYPDPAKWPTVYPTTHGGRSCRDDAAHCRRYRFGRFTDTFNILLLAPSQHDRRHGSVTARTPNITAAIQWQH